MVKKPNSVAMLEASLQACLRNALAARKRLSAARERHDLRDPLAFLTRAEVNELREEHKKVIALIQGPKNPIYARMAKLAIANSRQVRGAGGAAVEDREIATREAAAAIVRAGNKRRAETED